jgi:hypothetical protein
MGKRRNPAGMPVVVPGILRARPAGNAAPKSTDGLPRTGEDDEGIDHPVVSLDRTQRTGQLDGSTFVR